MPVVVIVLDLIAGLLIGAQFLVSKKLHKSIDVKLRNLLSVSIDDENELNKKYLLWGIIPTILTLVGIIVWAISKDIARGTTAPIQLTTSVILALAGVVAGVVSLILAAWTGKLIIKYMAKYMHFLRKFDLLYGIWIIAMILIITALLLLKILPAILILPAATYIISVSTLSTWMQLTPLAQRYLTFERGVLARLGLIVFITSKAIQLNYYL